jgi:hypothetical protein
MLNLIFLSYALPVASLQNPTPQKEFHLSLLCWQLCIALETVKFRALSWIFSSSFNWFAWKLPSCPFLLHNFPMITGQFCDSYNHIHLTITHGFYPYVVSERKKSWLYTKQNTTKMCPYPVVQITQGFNMCRFAVNCESRCGHLNCVWCRGIY